MEVTATVEGNELVIRLPLEAPHPSTSGKTLIVAGTGGFKKTTAKVGEKFVSVSVNATVPRG